MQCRVAKSLGALDATHQEAWGTTEYRSRNEPAVFFGLYDLRDYIALWRHSGKAWVLWAGSDLENLAKGFIFNDGKLHTLSKILQGNSWLMPTLTKAEHYVENSYELGRLVQCGLDGRIVPSFLGRIEDYELNFSPSEEVHAYVSAHPGREEEYGFSLVEGIAQNFPDVRFHLYGATWTSKHRNVYCHGKVPKEEFNEDIKNYHCGLRLNETDGFSEVTAKSILMGQYPITRIKSPWVYRFTDTHELVSIFQKISKKKKPNYAGRKYYQQKLNQYPWVIKNIVGSGRTAK